MGLVAERAGSLGLVGVVAELSWLGSRGTEATFVQGRVVAETAQCREDGGFDGWTAAIRVESRGTDNCSPGVYRKNVWPTR